MSQSGFYCARFYVTYRCNSRCVYCNVWQNKAFSNVQELPLEDAKELLKQCYELGVRYVDFTGGEPTLYPHLAEVIKYAKELGIKTEVTSNCIATTSKRKMIEVAATADKFNTSLDTLDNESYYKIRGVNSCENVKQTVSEIATVRSPKIMTVITENNISQLNKMIEYAEANNALIYLSPMFPYVDKNGNYCISEYIQDIVNQIYRPNTVVLLHFMDFFKNSSPNHIPPCSANQHTLTIAPNGNVVLPCYHAIKEEIQWNHNLKAAVQSKKFKEYMDKSGKLPVCNGCCVIPYFGISFNYQLNKYFILQSYSEKLYHLKQDVLNPLKDELTPDTQNLLSELQNFWYIADNISYKPDIQSYHCKNVKLYPTEIKGNAVYTPIYKHPLTKQQYEIEQNAKDCWQLKYVPHSGFDDIVENVLKKIARKQGHSLSEIEALNNSLRFQLYWWKVYVVDNFKLSIEVDVTKEKNWLNRYFDNLLENKENEEVIKRVKSIIS